MEIRDQMTATVRLTPAAASRFRSFIQSLSKPPKNINEAINLGLASLPSSSFIDDWMDLQNDWCASLRDIEERFSQVEMIRRVDWYFLALCAKHAIVESGLPVVAAGTITTILDLTAAGWTLSSRNAKNVPDEQYFLGNLSGRPFESGKKITLMERIETLKEHAASYRSTSAAEFAIRNVEVLLRDELQDVSDSDISRAFSSCFRALFLMAVRGYFLQNGKPFPVEDGGSFGGFAEYFNGFYGPHNELHVSQHEPRKLGFILTVPMGERSVCMCANNIVEIEEFTEAFTGREDDQWFFEGPNISITKQANTQILSHGERYMIGFGRVRFWITEEEFSRVQKAFHDFKHDPEVLDVISSVSLGCGVL